MPERPLNCCKSRDAVSLAQTAVSPASSPAISTDLVERFAQDYLLDCDYRLHSAHTIAARRIFLKNLVWFLHHRGYPCCSAAELRQFFVYLAHGHEEVGGRFGNKQLKRAVRPITHKDYWVNFKCFFNWLIEEGLIEASPMARLAKPRVPDEPSSRSRQIKSKRSWKQRGARSSLGAMKPLFSFCSTPACALPNFVI